VPVILDNKVAAHITLVNPQRNYEISDIEAVSRLAKYFALAIQLLREDEALRISENRFRDIALSMSDLIWEIDINGRYSWCSEKITDVLGFSADELLGKAVYDKMLPDQSSKFRNTFEKAIQNKKALTDLEVWTQHKDGSQVCLLSNGVPIFDDLGNVVGYRGVDKDITERKLAESQLLATNEKLLSTNTVLEHKTIELQDTMDKLLETQKQLIQSEKMASLGVLTAGIAHEINNPINFISSNTAGLENSVNTILATFEKYKEITIENHMEKLAEIKEYEKDMEVSFFLSSITALMNGIKEGVNRTTEIIKAMRTFTRADEKEMSFVDIHTFIDTSLIILKHQHANEIEINKVFAKLPNIKCYSSQLSQLFINLLSNAIQSIDKKGTITITTSYAEKDAMVNISIKDTGCGIPLEIKQKIFDPFFTTKPVGKGTGLGLSICYDIIQKHKGQIQLISEVGKGSEFIISLPVNK